MPTPKTSDVLKKARSLIEKEENWLRGVFAIGSDGTAVVSSDPRACKFCSVGAIRNAAWTWPKLDARDMFLRYAERSLIEVMGKPITNFNDWNSHEEVLKAFDRAIEQELMREAKEML